MSSNVGIIIIIMEEKKEKIKSIMICLKTQKNDIDIKIDIEFKW